MGTKTFAITFSAIALFFLSIFGIASSAQAGWYTLTVTSDTSDVLRNSPTPAMVISVASFTPGSSGFSKVNIDFRYAGGGTFWAWKNTCAGSGRTLADCGIASVSVGGVNQTPQSVELANNNQEVSITFTQTFTATTTVVISLSPGALTTPDTASVAVADVFFGPYVYGGMDDSGMTGGININSTVTLNPGGAPGTAVTQYDNHSNNLTANPFTRNGYTFAGWATSNGSSTVVYNDADLFNFANNQELYAVWTQNTSSPSPTPTATPTPVAASATTSTPLAQTGTLGPISLEVAVFITLSGAIIVIINRRKLFK